MTDSLPQRMREAAQTLRDVARYIGVRREDDFEATPRILENDANLWEAADAATAAEREALVNELAADLYDNHQNFDPFADRPLTRGACHVIAKRLERAGWTKQVAE